MLAYPFWPGTDGAQSLVDELAAEYAVPAPEVVFALAHDLSYSGLYHSQGRPPKLVVVEAGTRANVVVHEFVHHLQWRPSKRLKFIPRDSRGRWLWHHPPVFIPLLDEATKIADDMLTRRPR
jgi:hypothetical protein